MSTSTVFTAPVGARGAPPPEPATAGPGRPGGRRRRRLAVTAVAAVGLVTVVVLMVLAAAGARSGDPYDPQSPTPQGSQALARVLADHGVDVVVARGLDAFLADRVDSGTTVFVASTSRLDPTLFAEFAAHAAPAGRAVIATSDSWVLGALGTTWAMRPFPAGGTVATSCGIPDVRAGERISPPDLGIAWQPATGVHACYQAFGLAAYVELPTGTTGRAGQTTLLSDPTLWTNERIATGDQAALALRALSHTGRLLWYVPTQADLLGSGNRTIEGTLPGWFRPSLWLLAAGLAAVILWRGRRLGPLVREPLPVQVRAIETTQARGRMYRAARDPARAGLILQLATVRRLGRHLGLPRHTPAAVVAARVVDAGGAPWEQVNRLLTGPPPGSDGELAQLAVELAALERTLIPSGSGQPTPPPSTRGHTRR